MLCGIKVVWHDHYGNAEMIGQRKARMLRWCSHRFDAVVSVNEILREWAVRTLFVPKERIVYLRNFAVLRPSGTIPDLPGKKGKRIVCLANLRPQKDHMTLIEAFEKIIKKVDEPWHLLLVGEDRNDAYSTSLKASIERKGLQKYVHILGSRSDTADILKACDIGVLSSRSEGLPVALLEYALAGLPSVCTDVGQCAEVAGGGKYAKVVPPENPETLAEAIKTYIEDDKGRVEKGHRFRTYVDTYYGENAAVKRLVEIYKKVVDV
jgi:glycosyltransferase involved in cell wall biosynthesis